MSFKSADEELVGLIKLAIEGSIPDGSVDVSGGGGHFSISVVSPVFAGKNKVQSQRLVYSAIRHLMDGERAPVHAVDQLSTRVPTEASA